MIHVALFSFQRTTLSFEACFLAFVRKLFASSDFYILSHRAELVKKFFLSFFKFFWLSANPLPVKASGLLPLPYLLATFIMIQDTR